MAKSTPERLLTRGTIVPAVVLIMKALQVIYPRRTFPAVDPASDQLREAVLDPAGWVLGGTSPGGAYLGPPKGNYFIGDPNVERDGPPPQRIVWAPPEEGEERYVAPQRIGNMIGGAPIHAAASAPPGRAVRLAARRRRAPAGSARRAPGLHAHHPDEGALLGQRPGRHRGAGR